MKVNPHGFHTHLSQYCVSDIQFQISNIKTWISAAITDENICTLGFDDRKISELVLIVRSELVLMNQLNSKI